MLKGYYYMARNKERDLEGAVPGCAIPVGHKIMAHIKTRNYENEPICFCTCLERSCAIFQQMIWDKGKRVERDSSNQNLFVMLSRWKG